MPRFFRRFSLQCLLQLRAEQLLAACEATQVELFKRFLESTKIGELLSKSTEDAAPRVNLVVKMVRGAKYPADTEAFASANWAAEVAGPLQRLLDSASSGRGPSLELGASAGWCAEVFQPDLAKQRLPVPMVMHKILLSKFV